MSRTWNWGWNSSHASHRALCCDLYFLVCVTPLSTTQDGIPESTGNGGPRQFISHFPSSGLLYAGEKRSLCRVRRTASGQVFTFHLLSLSFVTFKLYWSGFDCFEFWFSLQSPGCPRTQICLPLLP